NGGRRAARPPGDDAIAGAAKAIKYIDFLSALGIWGFEDVPLAALLRPMRLSAVDLSGVDRKIADFLVTKIVSEVWKTATRDGLARPVFLVLEEAHNFVPAGKDEGRAGWWLKRVASEGRKFGIFLVLVTQRPYRVHQDTLSQCGSQIIMRLTNPEDQNAVRRASESISESLLADLPGLNVGEAVVLGPTVRVPVMVRVRRRESDEGGSDIDLVEALTQARAELGVERFAGRAEAERAARGRQPWREEI
ncbi:MAG: ATP-binding protein, partial [Chloroflexi bacterium]|nr:ATP-binding protein [Chloroflexota bacterium]